MGIVEDFKKLILSGKRDKRKRAWLLMECMTAKAVRECFDWLNDNNVPITDEDLGRDVIESKQLTK